METQKTLNGQRSLEKEEWSWWNQPSGLQITTKLQLSRQYGTYIKKKYRPIKQDRKPRNKLTHL